MKKKPVAPTAEAISWRKTLEAIPLRNTAAGVREDAEGHRLITVAKIKPWYIVPPISWIVKIPDTSTMQLDRLGSEVWELCDGKHTVENVVESFAANHGLTFHEARAAVSTYFKLLMQKGALAMAQPRESDEPQNPTTGKKAVPAAQEAA